MSNNPIERPRSFPGRLGTVLCAWFLTGMFLSMLLSGIYSVAGLLLPPLFFFLSATIYLAGGLLGGLWSRESLRRRKLARIDVIVTLFVLLLSIGFLLLSIIFVIMGFRHL
ncbi:MAG: hypothetical protein M3Y81_09975 [Chloroflexota bacterium]|nr:hypothetical protein [Chloroflexota bacterium]